MAQYQESDNLKRWMDSGEAESWVGAHRGEWNHEDWLALLDSLRKSKYWPMNPDDLGLFLEQTKRKYSKSWRVWDVGTQPYQDSISSGLYIVHKLRGHMGGIRGISWSPNGLILASASGDKTIRLWDAQSGKLLRILESHKRTVFNLAWSPNNRVLASASEDKTIRLWDVQNGELLRTLDGHSESVQSVSWSPDGQTLASASADRTIRLWDTQSGELLRILDGHSESVQSVSWSPDGQTLASASADRTIRLWDTQSGELLRRLDGHGNVVWSVSWSSDGQTLASASADRTIRLWNPESGITEGVLEAHTDEVMCVCFSDDGLLLASKGVDSYLRLWSCKTWEQIATIAEPSGGFIGGLAFHPDGFMVATPGEDESMIRIWELDYDVLLTNAAALETRHYRNAKVVLVGDTGVGKTGLGLVLTGKQWKPTESTHGRHVWLFGSHKATLPNGLQETRETLIWDLAGQPGYRLVHQLHLNEVAVALVIFDARSETDPFAGVYYWGRALGQAQKLQEKAPVSMKKYLTAARIDRGGVSVSRERIEAIIRKLGFTGFFETSAKENLGIVELIATIEKEIDWGILPQVSSNTLFHTIKEFLIAEKMAKRVLSTVEDLFWSFCHAHDQKIDDKSLQAKFETCIGFIENRGLIRRLSFGGLVLLQPELLDTYASAMVNAARTEPDGLGCIAEEDALAGRFLLSSDARIANKAQEKLLLIATVGEILRHEIGTREVTDAGADIIFPSQFTRERADQMEATGKAVIFTFNGPVVNIYATMAVRLSHGYLFKKLEMWKNAAIYRANFGGNCGIHLREIDEGQGELTLFFDSVATEETRFQFEAYIKLHLQRRALPGTIIRRRIFACSNCNVTIPDEMSRLRRERGFKTMNCPVCDTQVSILDGEERVTASVTSTRQALQEIDHAADKRRDNVAAEMMIKGEKAALLKRKIESGDYDVFLCHNSKDKPSVKVIGERLKEQGILPWLDEWELQPGLPWQPALEKQINRIKAVAVFIGPDGIGPWQDIEQQAFLREFVKRRCPVIPVIMPDCVNIPELPTFLSGMTRVDFHKLDPDPLEQLIWGVTGKNKFYDVFLCHNSKDKLSVKVIGERLREQDILPWLDEWELQTDTSWQLELRKQINRIKAVAVFIGPDGIGPWQDPEQQDFLQEFAKLKRPVIPVILPNCINVPELPQFLKGMDWVDFRKLHPDPLEQLIRGVTGKNKV